MADAERADTYDARATTATVSSLKSEDSTEQLICKTPQKKVNKVKKDKSVSSKSVEAGSDEPTRRRLVVFLGLAQVVLGALLVGAGALAVVKGAALSRVGAGLWAGCVAVVAGVVGVLAGINDCYGLNAGANGSPLLTAFLALSLLCLACGNSAAVLAATGLQRDSLRQPTAHASFEDEMEAWTPVLTNIALLIIASVHCVVCIISIAHVAKRVCPCLRPKQPFDHNQFEPGAPPHQLVIKVDDVAYAQDAERARHHELCKELEVKLQGDTMKKKKEEPEFGSANSKEKLVSRWLGRQQTPAGPTGPAVAAGAPAVLVGPPPAARRRGVRKPRKPPPLVLLPAHPASTLGRVPAACVVMPPRYATLPLPPATYAPGPLYYPVHDARVRRRRSPRATTERRRREGRERESQLARSLERIHRKRRADREHLTDADLKRTYTGLDRAYAEQFIAVCDSSRHAAEQHDSLASTSATSDSSHSQPELA
ncbi:uncharacterized protein LOC124633007 [Helicoverpa zea]|uniref:uncharacterized protein LOC124633007 n=1 Tax=Helicoverpa zea TaxID=7113 RepID=UPI001F59D6F5|nr:uncharacterized protein LOC124633007 [Helicoverpa zea]